MTPTPHSTFRLSAEAKAALVRLSEHYGISMTDVVEMLIRERARKELGDRKPPRKGK